MESILQLSAQKGNGRLFVVPFDEWGDVPFKLPGNKRANDYAVAISLANNEGVKALIREEIFRECVLSETRAFDDLEIPAGIVHSIAELILFLSGVGTNGLQYTLGILNVSRNMTKIPTMMMKRIICSVFGGYTFESLDALDYQEFVNLFAQAEAVMLESGMISAPYQFTKSNEKGKTENLDELIKEANRGIEGVNTMLPPELQGIKAQDFAQMKKAGTR